MRSLAATRTRDHCPARPRWTGAGAHFGPGPAPGVDGPRLGQRIHRQSGEDATAGAKARVRPDNAPPKWVFRNITAIRENTDRILELWGLAVQGLPRSP